MRRIIQFQSLALALLLFYFLPKVVYAQQVEDEGEYTLISTSWDGGSTDGYSGYPSVSVDERYISFQSSATNLTDVFIKQGGNVYRKDLLTGEIKLISYTHEERSRGSGLASTSHMSANGKCITYSARAGSIVSDDRYTGYSQVYLYTSENDKNTLVSRSYNGELGNAGSRNAHISSDCKFIAYESYATNLDSLSREAGVYLYDINAGSNLYVPTFDSVPEDGAVYTHRPSFSSDGRYLLVQSDLFLSGGSRGGETRFYVYDTLNLSSEPVDLSLKNDSTLVFQKYLLSGAPKILYTTTDEDSKHLIYILEESKPYQLLGFCNDVKIAGISQNGNYAILRCEDTRQVYLLNLLTRESLLLDITSELFAFAIERQVLSVSNDGSRIYFTGYDIAEEDRNSAWDIYLYEYSLPSVLLGNIISSSGTPISQVNVLAQSKSGNQSTTVSNASGYFSMTVPTGIYSLHVEKVGYEFDLQNMIVNSADESEITFIGRESGDLSPDPIIVLPNPGVNPTPDFNSTKTPLLIVHGWQMSSGYNCALDGPFYLPDLQSWSGNVPIGDMPQWFQDDGRFDVWIAFIDSSNGRTVPFDENANCLKRQVINVSKLYSRKIEVVAHSMGGIVTRRCLSYTECSQRISGLTTLGSPHGGVNPNYLVKLLGFNKADIAQFSLDSMVEFNHWNPNLNAVRYAFVAGDANTAFSNTLAFITGRNNDGFVSTQSGLGNDPRAFGYNPEGWAGSAALEKYITDETHASVGLLGGNSYYSNRNGKRSRAYNCTLFALFRDVNTNGEACLGTNVQAAQATEVFTLPQFTVPITGVISAGSSVSRQILVDSNQKGLFIVRWQDGSLEARLTSPSGEVVSPTFVSSSENDSYQPSAYFEVIEAEAGVWELTLSGTNLGSDNLTEFTAFAILETATKVVSEVAQHLSLSEGTQVITVTLSDNLTSESVVLSGKTNSGLTAIFEPSGPNTFVAHVQSPATAAGEVVMTIQVHGYDGQTSFERELVETWSIVQQSITAEITQHSISEDGKASFSYKLSELPEDCSMQVVLRSTSGTATTVQSISSTAGTLSDVDVSQLSGSVTVDMKLTNSSNTVGVYSNLYSFQVSSPSGQSIYLPMIMR